MLTSHDHYLTAIGVHQENGKLVFGIFVFETASLVSLSLVKVSLNIFALAN
jgi:hypothetical protein